MDCETQKDEIIALKSIYNEEEFSYHEENNQYQCTFKIFINLPEGYYFTYRDNRQLEQPAENVPMSHLPPLTLFITLPLNYPSESPPAFMLHSSWLSQPALAKLCQKLDQLWVENKGLEILFMWVAFLKDETLDYLNIRTNLEINYAYTSYKMALEKAQSALTENKETNVEKTNDKSNNYDRESAIKVSQEDQKLLPKKRYRKQKIKKLIDQRAVSDKPTGRNPVQMLIDYDMKRKQIEFKKNFYLCKICFTDKLGAHCTQFTPCSHVFCKDCITGYLEVRINDGAVQNICCPADKCTSEATPGQVKDLVSPELFAKYDSILLNATLNSMMDIIYCPRPHCQYPVSQEPNEQMARCPACHYAFCINCKMVYHGIERCKFKLADAKNLIMEYQNASDEAKARLEKRYGKKQLQELVENAMSENWIDTNSQRCPKCKTAIEKSDGCNKMTCWKCNTFFCWLCGSRLNPDAAYSHYQSSTSKCFQKLFHGVVPDEEDDDDDEEFNFPAIYLGDDLEDNFYNEDVMFELYL